jgi:hypothetical protein
MAITDAAPAAPALPFDPFGVWRWAAALHAPLSGAVNQAIQASLVHGLGQLGLVNIATAAAGDPALERRVVEQVASYGRQLGWVVDALDVLVRARRDQEAEPGDEAALDQVQKLRDQVEGLKRREAAERVDALVEQIRLLNSEPQADAPALDKLRAALAEG